MVDVKVIVRSSVEVHLVVYSRQRVWSLVNGDKSHARRDIFFLTIWLPWMPEKFLLELIM